MIPQDIDYPKIAHTMVRENSPLSSSLTYTMNSLIDVLLSTNLKLNY